MAARQPQYAAGDAGVCRHRPRQHLLSVHDAPRPSWRRRRTRASSSRSRSRRPNSTLQQRQLYSRQVYKIFASHPETEHVFQLDVPGQSIAGMVFKPWDQRTQDHQRAAAGAAAGAEQGRGRARRRLPAAGAARQLRPAGAVRHRDHGSVRAAQRCRPAIPAGSAEERHVHLPRLRPEDRQSAIRHRHRSRQDRAARPEDERCRRRAVGDARRRLCQLFQHQRALLQSHPAGAAALPAQRAAVARLLHPHRRRFAGPAVDHREHQDAHGAGIAQSFSAAQRRHDPGRRHAGRRAGRRAGVPAESVAARRCRRAIRSITAA